MVNKEILIIGAGSTGLSLALFLADLGYKPRIIDKREPSTITKALGVNPNTLSLLESTGVTNRFLENGWKAHCMNFWFKDKLLYKNDFSGIKHKYPFMLIQPQCDTERILEEALFERGISVSRGIELITLNQNDSYTEIDLKDKGGNVFQEEFKGIIIGADGGRSKVRESLNIDFKGWEHDEEFTIYDLELETTLNPNEGHYFIFKEGAMLMLHIRNGVWRVAGNMDYLLNYLPKGTKMGDITWETKFKVKEKVADKFHVGNVFILGDAAHLHSPVGGKGMNLCIEDSYIFSKLIKENREAEFYKIRHKEISKNVGLLGQITDKIGGQNFIGTHLRNNMDKLSFMFPLIMPRMRKFLLGIN